MMQRLLCTLGFPGKTAEEFFTLLSGAGVQQVIDVRQNRGGQLSGFSKHPDLSFFLRKIGGMAFHHALLSSPPPELIKMYRRLILKKIGLKGSLLDPLGAPPSNISKTYPFRKDWPE